MFWPGLSDLFLPQNPGEFCASHSPGRILVCAFGSMVKFQFLVQFPADHLSYPVMSSLVLFLR